MKFNLQKLSEEKVGFLIIFVSIIISVGLLVTVIPLFGEKGVLKSTAKEISGIDIKPYTALQLAGRDIYIKEGCYVCHSQMIRPFRAETERYGHYSVAAESIYDYPFQWGSKRTGPDLSRVGGRYSDTWHQMHLINPRDVVPESVMPAYPHVANYKIDVSQTIKNMKTLKKLGVPYTKEDFDNAKSSLSNEKGEPKTQLEALISYLQVLGTSLKTTR